MITLYIRLKLINYKYKILRFWHKYIETPLMIPAMITAGIFIFIEMFAVILKRNEAHLNLALIMFLKEEIIRRLEKWYQIRYGLCVLTWIIIYQTLIK